MKKGLIIAATILAGFSLAGCGDHHSTSKTTYKIKVDLKTNGKQSSVKANKGSATSTVKSSSSSKNQSSKKATSEDNNQDGDDGSGYAGCNYQDDFDDDDVATKGNNYDYHAEEGSSSVYSSSSHSSSSNDDLKTVSDETNTQEYTYNPTSEAVESEQE